MRLAYRLRGQTWLAYPCNEGDARQRVGAAQPMIVHLVTEGADFDPIITRGGSGQWWFVEIDRRVNPQDAERLRESFRETLPLEGLRFKGLTPEMKVAYGLRATQAQEQFAKRQEERDRGHLREALNMAGGELGEFRDRGDYWQVEWTTGDGARHTSAIAKSDLTVMSSGICLSGRDNDFDLQSLVGVVERRDPEWEE